MLSIHRVPDIEVLGLILVLGLICIGLDMNIWYMVYQAGIVVYILGIFLVGIAISLYRFRITVEYATWK